MEKLLDEVNLMNDGTPTHFSSQYGTFSAIDINLCDPKISPRLQWLATESLYGSDYFPTIITNLTNTKITIITNEKWNLYKADWTAFTQKLE